MLDHFVIIATNLSKSKSFYQKALKPLGYELRFDFENVISFASEKTTDPGGDFWIKEKKNGTPIHFAFNAKSRDAVKAFYQAGLEAGGADNGAPGLRTQYHENYYAAFLIDPDGNNVEAVCHLN